MMTEIDLSEVKAGTYVLLAHSWDQITSKPSEPYDYVTHRRGDEIELDKAEARRLVASGSAVAKADYNRAERAVVSGPLSALDDAGVATLREKLNLADDAGQDAILAALDARSEGHATELAEAQEAKAKAEAAMVEAEEQAKTAAEELRKAKAGAQSSTPSGGRRGGGAS